MARRVVAPAVASLVIAACTVGSGGGGGGDTQRMGDGGGDASAGAPDLAGCEGAACQPPPSGCPAGQETTLTGTVTTPKGDLPLYNVSVFVPGVAVPPLPDGLSCDTCAGFAAAKPVVSALTGPDGRFTLKNVPAGDNVPVVLQVGKWRRQITVPRVTACTTAPIPPAQLAMPRSKAEGDLPRIAIATGLADPFECLLPKIGIDPAEVTAPTGTGRVHYYRNRHTDSGGNPADGRDLAGGAPDASTLFDDPAQLKKYDIVLLPCEAAEFGGKSATAAANMRAYADQGGRLFTTHYSYTWVYGTKTATLPWSSTGTWNVRQPFDDATGSTLVGKIDQGFPKGMAFAEWLVKVGASAKLGELVISEWRHDLDQAATPPSTRWIYGATPAFRYQNIFSCNSDNDCMAANRPCVANHCTTGVAASTTDNSVQHITFNTPIDQPVQSQCGRVVYSDFHVSAAALKANNDPTNLKTFPSMCKAEPPSAQEKALIFMLFDLSACVQDDTKAPEPPPIF